MIKHICILALFMFAGTAAALRAAPVDPKIIVSGGGDATNVTSDVFTFQSDPNGGGVFTFINDSNSNWLSLDFLVTLPSGSMINCSSSVYQTCESSFTTIDDTNLARYDIGFDNPIGNGIFIGDTLTINLNDNGNDVNGAGSWGPNNTFSVAANAPEPSSFLFLAGGILLLSGLRRYSRRGYF